MPDRLIAVLEKDGDPDDRREAYNATDVVNLKARGYHPVLTVDPDTLVETPVDEDGDGAAPVSPEVPPELVPPPLGGVGSGTEEWREYAAQLGVDVEDLDKRDDIVEAIHDAGYPTEVDPDQ